VQSRHLPAAGTFGVRASLAACSSSTGPGAAGQLAVADLAVSVGAGGVVRPFRFAIGYQVPSQSFALAFTLTPNRLVFPPATRREPASTRPAAQFRRS